MDFDKYLKTIEDNPNINPYGIDTLWEGLGYFDYLLLPHYQLNHKETKLIDNCVGGKRNEKIKNILAAVGSVVKSHIKLLLILIAIIVIIIIAINFISGGPEKAVKAYIGAMNDANTEEFINNMDLRGAMAWSKCGEDENKFQEEYDKIDVNSEDTKKQFETAEKGLESMVDMLDDNLEDYSIKVKEFKDTEKLTKGLYRVKVQIETKAKNDDGEEEENTATATFLVYNNKVIDMEND